MDRSLFLLIYSLRGCRSPIIISLIWHGPLLPASPFFILNQEKQLEAAAHKDEIFQTFFGGRYVIFLMGAFSIYTGFLYNDVFAKSVNVFGSGWTNCYDLNEIDRLKYGEEKTLMLIPEYAYDSAGGPYPIGVDPIWNLAESNKLNFLNSMKMILSHLDIKFMFIPQMIFLASIFIYLCLEQIHCQMAFLHRRASIFGYKYPGSNCAPSLLIGLINMFMFKTLPSGFVDEEGRQKFQCHLNFWYPGQGIVERVLLVLAVVQVPLMLFVKPLILRYRSRVNDAHYFTLRDESVRADMNGDDAEVVHSEPKTTSAVGSGGGDHGHGGSGTFEFGEVMVYQAIHTIEFVLGCVSHTASYLRLWALSLAHAQLSDVLWTMVFRHSFRLDGYYGAVATYVLFFVFGSLSIFILVLMEGLSAFLHALRLHWSRCQPNSMEAWVTFHAFPFRKSLKEEREAQNALIRWCFHSW
ncbi:V-type ATPase subunit family protein [Ostertagia ostertagi]